MHNSWHHRSRKLKTSQKIQQAFDDDAIGKPQIKERDNLFKHGRTLVESEVTLKQATYMPKINEELIKKVRRITISIRCNNQVNYSRSGNKSRIITFHFNGGFVDTKCR